MPSLAPHASMPSFTRPVTRPSSQIAPWSMEWVHDGSTPATPVGSCGPSCGTVKEAVLTTSTFPVSSNYWQCRQCLGNTVCIDCTGLKPELLADNVCRLIVVPHVVTADCAPLHAVRIEQLDATLVARPSTHCVCTRKTPALGATNEALPAMVRQDGWVQG